MCACVRARACVSVYVYSAASKSLRSNESNTDAVCPTQNAKTQVKKVLGKKKIRTREMCRQETCVRNRNTTTSQHKVIIQYEVNLPKVSKCT